MRYKVVVFDFDGTLVDSNKIKIDAYYQVFPSDIEYIQSIQEVLVLYPELNRYDTIKKILDKIGGTQDPNRLADEYSDVVLDNVIKARKLGFSTETLDWLHHCGTKLYLSSNTPQVVLEKILAARGLDKYFCEISGYPKSKSSFLKGLITVNSFSAHEYLVVGDGDSDKFSAKDNGADFFHVDTNSLEELYLKLTTEGDISD